MTGNEVPETGQLIASALLLPIDDRLSLVNAMLESVEQSTDDSSQAEIDKAWNDEIAARVKEIKSGNADTVSSSELWSRIGGKPNVRS